MIIPSFPLYDIDEEGVIRNINKQNVIKPLLNGRYYKVGLQRDGKRVTGLLVHRLLAEAFLGPCPENMCVRHLDGNCLNNVLSNIAYGTLQQNQLDRIEHGTMGSKLDADKVRTIRDLKRRGFTTKRLCEMFNVCRSHMKAIVSRRVWKSI